MPKEVASSCRIVIEQSIERWIKKMAKIMMKIPAVNNELLAFDGVSDEIGIDQCEQYIGVETGTIKVKEDIIRCISYDAAIHALDFSSGYPRSSISQYYQYHLRAPIELAWRFVCKSISSVTDKICETSALLLIGITKGNAALVDSHQFFRCRTFLAVYTLLHQLGKFLLEAWDNNNSVSARAGKRIRPNRMRLSPTSDLVKRFLEEVHGDSQENMEIIGGPCGSTTAHQKEGQKKRERTSHSSNEDGSDIDHTGDSNTCHHEAGSSSESSITDSPSPDQNCIAYRSRDSLGNRVPIEHNQEVGQAAECQAGLHQHSSGCSVGECSSSRPTIVTPPLDDIDNSSSPSNHCTDAIKGKPPSSNLSCTEIEKVFSYEGLIRVLPTAHVNSENELEMCKDDWMAFVNSQPVAKHCYDILSR